MAIQIPNPTNWKEIDHGSKAFPRIIDFSTISPAQKTAHLRELDGASIKNLKALRTSKRPNSYEETHRAYVSFWVGMNAAMGMTEDFRRIQSEKEVQAIRFGTKKCLEAGVNPGEAFREFVDRLSKFNSFDPNRLRPCYVFSSNNVWVPAVFAVKAKRMGDADTSNSNALNSFEDASGLDPKIRKVLEKVPSFDHKTSDKEILSYLAAAKLWGKGFIPSKLKPFAEVLFKEIISCED